MLGQPHCAARSTPRWVSSWRIQSLRSRATASLRAPSSSGSRPCSLQAGPGLLAQPGGDLGVVGLGPHLEGDAVAVRDLLLDREVGAGQVAPAGEVAHQLLVLPDLARPVAGHEAGAGVDQRRPLHAPDEGDDVLGALHVGAQGRLERRVEGDLARRVDDHVDVAGHRRGRLVGQAQVGLGDVAVDHPHLVAQEGGQPLGPAVGLAQGIEDRRGDDACSRSGPRCWCPSPGGP